MLVQRLVEYAREKSTSKPFHRQREFVWRLEVPSTGQAPGLVRARPDDPRGRGQRHLAPSVTRTVGVAPQLGADDVQYVLGWGDETTKPERVSECHRQFVELISRWAEFVGEECPEAAVVRDFYARGGVDELVPTDEVSAKQGVLITVDERPIIRLESLSRFWVEEVARRKTGGTSGLCLVCGRQTVLADTVPGNVSKRLVPGAANNAALISVNERVFGYGLSTGLEHTPICLACGDAMTTALTDLLSGQHAVSLPQQDSVLTWWVLGETPENFYEVMPDRADPHAVSELLDRFHRGAPLLGADALSSQISKKRFCSVTLGGNSSRIMIRDWIDMPLASFVAHLASWYNDHQTVTLWDDEPVKYSLGAFVRVAGRWDKERRRYRELTDKADGRPENIYRDVLRAALRGTPLPPSVLQHVLHRVSNDGRVDGPRVALLRLALRRHPRKEINVPVGLDETRTHPAYIAGRAFAIYEKIQYISVAPKRATNGDEPPRQEDQDTERERKTLNATFTDRYFSGAISNPRPALTAASNLLTGWLAKIRREKSPGLAYRLKEELEGVLWHLDGVPGRLGPEQQGQFILGYHHQCAHDTAERRKRKQLSEH